MKNPYQDTIDWLNSDAGEDWSYDTHCTGDTPLYFQQETTESVRDGVYGFYSLKRTEECHWCLNHESHPVWAKWMQATGNLDVEGPDYAFADYWLSSYITARQFPRNAQNFTSTCTIRMEGTLT
jgi:hypothetical protein